MNLALYSRVVYIGLNGLYDCVEENDVGYIIEYYGDGNYEVEFSGADGSTKAQSVIPEIFLKSTERQVNPSWEVQTIMSDIEKLIVEYLQAVENCLKIFDQKFGRRDILAAWHEGVLPQQGEVTEGVEYGFHGIGCRVSFPVYEIDFDFAPGNRSDGFDLWRLSKYARNFAERFPVFQNIRLLESAFENLKESGYIVQEFPEQSSLFFLRTYVVSNPYFDGVPKASQNMMYWLPESANALKPGGQIVINGTYKNPFAKLPGVQELEKLGLRVVQDRGPLLPQFQNQSFNFTSGKPIQAETVKSTVLEKVR